MEASCVRSRAPSAQISRRQPERGEKGRASGQSCLSAATHAGRRQAATHGGERDGKDAALFVERGGRDSEPGLAVIARARRVADVAGVPLGGIRVVLVQGRRPPRAAVQRAPSVEEVEDARHAAHVVCAKVEPLEELPVAFLGRGDVRAEHQLDVARVGGVDDLDVAAAAEPHESQRTAGGEDALSKARARSSETDCCLLERS